MASSFGDQQRNEVLECATRIKHVTQLPSDVLTDLLIQQQQFACIRWLVHFRILEAIPPPPKAATYAEVAGKAGVPVQTLRSVARMAMTANFLDQTADELLCHSFISSSLVQNRDLSTWLSYLINRSVPCMTAFVEATERWPSPTEANQTAYNIAFNTDLPFFDHLKANGELGAEFGAYMKSQASVHAGASVEHLLRGFNWAALGDAWIVDIGGGQGDASIALAQVYPQLRFVIQDLKHSGEGARAKISALDDAVSRRIQFQEHDFFQEENLKGADVYLLRMIIHDWPDADAVRILRQVVKAMKPESRILIMDIILPAPGGPRNFEAALRQKDLTMKQVLNAREREVEDWGSLIHEVDSRLRIVGTIRPEGSQHSIMEVKLQA